MASFPLERPPHQSQLQHSVLRTGDGWLRSDRAGPTVTPERAAGTQETTNKGLSLLCRQKPNDGDTGPTMGTQGQKGAEEASERTAGLSHRPVAPHHKFWSLHIQNGDAREGLGEARSF